MNIHWRHFSAVVMVFAAACVEVPQRAVDEPRIQSGGNVAQTFTINRDQEVSVSFSHKRVLRAGTQWRYVGSLPEGAVYKPVNTVFTVQGRHVHEAYLVVNDGVLVGYYLPVERSISVADSRIPLDVTSP